MGAIVFLGAAAAGQPREAVHERLAEAMRTLAREAGGTSTCPRRAIVATDPPSLDRGEVTDKGYINQRAVLEHRAELVEALYRGGGDVVTA